MPASGIVLGVVLAASMLIRHVGVCLAIAVAIDLGLRSAVEDISVGRADRQCC